MKRYLITEEQLESLEHYKRMFEFNADELKNLCDSEKDEIVYGFELGRMHSHLRQCFIDMMELEDEIRKQQIDDRFECTDLLESNKSNSPEKSGEME